MQTGSYIFALGLALDVIAVLLAGRRSLQLPACVMVLNWAGVMIITSALGQQDPAPAFIALDTLSALVILWNGGQCAAKLAGIYWVAIGWSGIYALTDAISPSQYLWVLAVGGAGQIVILLMEAIDGTGRKVRGRGPSGLHLDRAVAAYVPRGKARS